MSYPPRDPFASPDASIALGLDSRDQPASALPGADYYAQLAAALTPEETDFLVNLPDGALDDPSFHASPVLQGITSKLGFPAPAPPPPPDPRLPRGGALDAVRALGLHDPTTWAPEPVPSHGPGPKPAVIRPPTWSEKLTGYEHDAYEGLASTLPVKMLDLLGVSGIAGKQAELEGDVQPVMFNTAPPPGAGGLFSRAEQAAAALPAKGVHPSKALSLMKGATSAEEVAYRGIEEFLASKGNSPVTAADMAAHLSANPAPHPTVARLEHSVSPALMEALRVEGWPVPRSADEWRSMADQWTHDARRLREYHGDDEAADILLGHARDAASMAGGPRVNQPRYDAYQVPGGTNYRENLFQLPVRGDAAGAVAAQAYPVVQTQRGAQINLPGGGIVDLSYLPRGRNARGTPVWLVGGVPGEFATREAALAAGQLRAAEVIRLRGAGPAHRSFVSSHFKQHPDLLLHTRSNERTLATGERGHFIEEIQSDWHQQGKKQGYAPATDPARLADVEKQLVVATEQMNAASDAAGAAQSAYLEALRKATAERLPPDLRKVTSLQQAMQHDLRMLEDATPRHGLDATSEWRAARGEVLESGALGHLKDAELAADRALQAAIAEVNHLQRVQLDIRRPSGVPDAPFKEAWPDLALKQHLLEAAADPNAQWLGFTDGPTQAARYDLSKHIDSLRWAPSTGEDAGHGVLSAFKDGERVMHEGMPEAKIADYVGKEAAEKLLGQPGHTVKRLDGQELEIGGKGMRHFYDNLLPSRLNKILKPFGAGVEHGTLASGEHAWVAKLSDEVKAAIRQGGLPLMAAAPVGLAVSHEQAKPAPAADPAMLARLAAQFPVFAATLASHPPPAAAQPPLAALQKAETIGATGSDRRTAQTRRAVAGSAPEGQPAVIRAPTWTEKLTGYEHDLYAALGQTLPGQILDSLGATGFAGKAQELETPPALSTSVLQPPVGKAPTAKALTTTLEKSLAEQPGHLAYAPAARTERGRVIVSAAMPTAKKAGWRADRAPIIADLRLVKEAGPEVMDKLAERLGSYDLVRPEDLAGKTSEQQLEVVIEAIKDNLLFLHDKTPEWIRGLSQQWYDGAHLRALEDAKRLKVTPEQMAGVMARLSPQKDWFQNAELARRLSETWRGLIDSNRPFDAAAFKQYRRSLLDAIEEDIAKAATAERKTILAEMAGGRTLTKDEIKAAKLVIKRDADGRVAAVKDEVRARKTKAVESQVRRDRTQYLDVPYRDLPLEAKGRMIRAVGETSYGTDYPMLLPTGEVGDLVRNTDGKAAQLGWGLPNNFIMDAVAILEDPSMENISARVGAEHKVRAFYTNIIDPSYQWASTIDTHAVAAGLLQPFSQSAAEVGYSMGGVGHAATGLSGSNPIFQEAYLRAAKDRGILPRQMQSITWESLRALFSASDKKNEAILTGARDLWAQHRAGKLSANQVRNRILDTAGGKIKEPAWVKAYEHLRPAE